MENIRRGFDTGVRSDFCTEVVSMKPQVFGGEKTGLQVFLRVAKWYAQQGSNLQPSPPEGDALSS